MKTEAEVKEMLENLKGIIATQETNYPFQDAKTKSQTTKTLNGLYTQKYLLENILEFNL